MKVKLDDRAVFMYDGKEIEVNGKMRKTIEFGYSFSLDLYKEKKEDIEKYIEEMTKRRGLDKYTFVIGNYCSACCSNLDDVGYIISGSFKASKKNNFNVELCDSVGIFDETTFYCANCSTEIKTHEDFLNL